MEETEEEYAYRMEVEAEAAAAAASQESALSKGVKYLGGNLDNLSNLDNWKDFGASALRGVGNVADTADAILGYVDPFYTKIPDKAPSQDIRQMVDLLGGTPETLDRGKDTPLGAAGELLGGNLVSAPLGPASVAMSGASAFLGGIGNKYGGKTGEVVGSLTPAGLMLMTKLLPHIIGPQSRAGAQAAVGEVAQQYGIGADDIDQALAAQASDPLLSSKTSAELLQSPELATLEQGMGGGAGSMSTDYAKAAQARGTAQEELLNALSPARGVPAEVAGEVVQNSWGNAKDFQKKVVNELYDMIPENVSPDTTGIGKTIEEATAKYYGEGAPEIPKGIRDRIAYLAPEKVPPKEPLLDMLFHGEPVVEETKKVTLQGLQRARSHLGDIATTAARAGNAQEAALATSIKESITDAIKNAPEGSSQWQEANAYYKQYAETFKDAPLKKLGDALPSSVVAKITASPEAAEQAYKAIGKDPKAMEAIKDRIASVFSDLSDARKVTFVSKNRSALKKLLGEDANVLEAIAKDIRSRGETAALANPTRGSNTALKLSDVVHRALTGKTPHAKPGIWSRLVTQGLSAGVAGGATIAHPLLAVPAFIAGAGGAALRGRSEDLVRQVLYEALMNPEALKSTLTAREAAAQAPGVGSALLHALGPAAVESQ